MCTQRKQENLAPSHYNCGGISVDLGMSWTFVLNCWYSCVTCAAFVCPCWDPSLRDPLLNTGLLQRDNSLSVPGFGALAGARNPGILWNGVLCASCSFCNFNCSCWSCSCICCLSRSLSCNNRESKINLDLGLFLDQKGEALFPGPRSDSVCKPAFRN